MYFSCFAKKSTKRRRLKEAHFRSAPLADFFGYFLVQRQESNITALKVCKKVYLLKQLYILYLPSCFQKKQQIFNRNVVAFEK